MARATAAGPRPGQQRALHHLHCSFPSPPPPPRTNHPGLLPAVPAAPWFGIEAQQRCGPGSNAPTGRLPAVASEGRAALTRVSVIPARPLWRQMLLVARAGLVICNLDWLGEHGQAGLSAGGFSAYVMKRRTGNNALGSAHMLCAATVKPELEPLRSQYRPDVRTTGWACKIICRAADRKPRIAWRS